MDHHLSQDCSRLVHLSFPDIIPTLHQCILSGFNFQFHWGSVSCQYHRLVNRMWMVQKSVGFLNFYSTADIIRKYFSALMERFPMIICLMLTSMRNFFFFYFFFKCQLFYYMFYCLSIACFILMLLFVMLISHMVINSGDVDELLIKRKKNLKINNTVHILNEAFI